MRRWILPLTNYASKIQWFYYSILHPANVNNILISGQTPRISCRTLANRNMCATWNGPKSWWNGLYRRVLSILKKIVPFCALGVLEKKAK